MAICEQHEELLKRHEKFEAHLEKAVERIQLVEIKTAEQQRDIKTVFTEIKKLEQLILDLGVDIKMLTGRSGRRWDMVVDRAILVVLASAILFFLSQVGV